MRGCPLKALKEDGEDEEEGTRRGDDYAYWVGLECRTRGVLPTCVSMRRMYMAVDPRRRKGIVGTWDLIDEQKMKNNHNNTKKRSGLTGRKDSRCKSPTHWCKYVYSSQRAKHCVAIARR